MTEPFLMITSLGFQFVISYQFCLDLLQPVVAAVAATSTAAAAATTTTTAATAACPASLHVVGPPLLSLPGSSRIQG